MERSGSLTSGGPRKGCCYSSSVELSSGLSWQNGESEVEPGDCEGRSDKLGKNSRAVNDRTVLRPGAIFSEPNIPGHEVDAYMCIYGTIEAELRSLLKMRLMRPISIWPKRI